MRSVNSLALGILLAAGVPGLHGQSQPATAAAKKPPAAAQASPLPRAAKTPGKAAAKPVVKRAAKASKSAEGGSAPAEGETKLARRDPFESLISHQQGGAAKNLPPGKAGLQVSTLRLDGVVRAPNGMIAVVSNPQARTYFLREGDQLYDGRVEKIALDGVSFHEIGKDAFGKPVERQVNKRIYASAGEQQ